MTTQLDSRAADHASRLVRLAWLITTALVLVTFVVNLCFLYAELLRPCRGVACGDDGFHLTAAEMADLHVRHFPISAYAGYQVGLYVLFFLVFGLVAAVIIYRAAHHRMARFVAFTLILWGGTFPSIAEALHVAQPAVQVLMNGLQALAGCGFYLLFFIFPTGQFVPRWTRWVLLVAALTVLLTTVAGGTALAIALQPLQPVVFATALVTALGAQVYRYRRVATPRERQQSKWVLCGMVIGVGVVLAVFLATSVIAPALQHGAFHKMLFTGVIYAGFLLVPVSIGIAMLRAQLWEIDRLINRVLVYGSLTATLALVYVGSVVLLQQLLRRLSGQTSPLAIVASTLAMAALFQPLRRRLQTTIDRRFYRRKYDAARILAAFSAHLRDEVDLDRLTSQLVTVVEETLQPVQVSLWLRDDGRRSRTQRVGPDQ